MNTQATMERRLAHLEESNRRLKAGFLALGVFGMAIAILGAAAPPPKILRAENFTLVDSAGHERAELSGNASSTALQFLNADNTRSLIVASGNAGSGFFLNNSKGEPRINLMASGDGTAMMSITKPATGKETFLVKDAGEATVLEVRDGNAKARIDLGYTEKGASLVVADANETARAMLGEQGIVTYNKGGKIEWTSLGQNMSPEERKHVMDLLNSTIPE